MVDSRIDAVDTLNEVVSSMVGASYALCYKATIEGDASHNTDYQSSGD